MSKRTIPLPLLLVSLTLASALLFFYVKTQDYDPGRYFDEVSMLRQLKQLDASWERDVLRSKVGMVQDYDALAEPLPELASLAARLDRLALPLATPDTQRLSAIVGSFRRTLATRQELVEAFKTHDAVLRNSVSFLPQARDDLEPLLPPELRDVALALLLDSLEFAHRGSRDELAEAAAGLEVLQAARGELSPQAQKRLDIFLAHIRTVLQECGTVNDLLRQLGQQPTAVYLDQMTTLLTGQQQQASSQAHAYRQYLLLFATALATLLLYAAFRLLRSHAMIRRFNRDLQLANEQLEQRVADRTRALQQEIAERQALESRLAQSEKLASIGQLAAGVAHEINNPLGFLSSNFGMLEEYLASLFNILGNYEEAERSGFSPALTGGLPARRAELQLDFLRKDIPLLMEQSRDGMSRVSKIVQSLKDFSRAGSHNDWHWADLHQGIDSTLHIIANELRKVADVRKEYGALPPVECRQSELNQVFLNLLVNAGHAVGPERGVITIRSGQEGDDAWIEIADNGCGIPPELLPRIFDPFFTTKPVGKGTGLGLSVSHGIVHSHGGRIEVQTAPGCGTAFRVVLPVRQCARCELEACLNPG